MSNSYVDRKSPKGPKGPKGHKPKGPKPKPERPLAQSWIQPGTMVQFRDGYRLFTLVAHPAADHIVTGGDVRLTSVETDRFGVPEHEHAKFEITAVPTKNNHGTVAAMIEEATRAHGVPIGISPIFSRWAGPYSITLQEAPSDIVNGEKRYIVIAFRMNGTPNFERGKTTTLVSLPEHEHWTPSASPLPFDAAWWIFTTVVAVDIERQRQPCNCPPPQAQAQAQAQAKPDPRTSYDDLGPDLPDLGASLPEVRDVEPDVISDGVFLMMLQKTAEAGFPSAADFPVRLATSKDHVGDVREGWWICEQHYLDEDGAQDTRHVGAGPTAQAAWKRGVANALAASPPQMIPWWVQPEAKP